MRTMVLLKMIWHHGGRVEKSVAILVGAAPFFALVIFLLFMGVIMQPLPRYEILYVGLAMVFALGSWPFYSPAIVRPLSSVRVIRASIEARALPSAQREFLEEVARYKDTLGVRGQIPGDVRLSFLYAIIYYGAGATGFLVSVGLYGSLGPLAPGGFLLVDAAITTACFLLIIGRRRRELDRAEKLGFRLRALYRTSASSSPFSRLRR